MLHFNPPRKKKAGTLYSCNGNDVSPCEREVPIFDKLSAANNTAVTHFLSERARALLADFWGAFSYGFAFWAFGVPIWKAVVVAVIALICCAARLHRNATRAVGLIALAIGLLVWTELLPPPAHWQFR